MADDTDNQVEAFIEAVANDEYAELELERELCAGCTLITDWEGDGTFHPYIYRHSDSTVDPTDGEVQSALTNEIKDRLDVRVETAEWSPLNTAWFLDMDRPDK